jgi:hypothetical protein
MFKWFKKKKEIEIVDSWDKMPLGMFIKIDKLVDADMDEDTKILKAVAILSNKSFEEIESLPLSEAMALVSKTSFLYSDIERGKFKNNLNLGGRQYCVLGSSEEMTAAQFIDFQAISKDVKKMLPEFMAIFIIPKGHKYGDGYNMVQVLNDIENHLTVVEALSMADFFTNAYKRLLKRTLLYYEAEMKVLSLFKKEQMKEIAEQTESMIKELRKTIASYGYH